MEDNKKKTPNFKEPENKPMVHENHKAPVTRRDFLAQGFIGMSASAFAPSMLGMLIRSNDAMAQDFVCATGSFTPGMPYLCMDVAGGMNIAGANVIVGMTAGGEHQEDYGSATSDYIRLGISPEESPKLSGKVDGTFGLKFHRASGILQGMNSVLKDDDGNYLSMPNGKPISDGIDGLIFCARTADDTSNNPLNTVYMANKAGASGQLVQLVGSQASVSGGRSIAPGGQINLLNKPSPIGRNEDTVGLLSIGDKLMGNNYLRAEQSGGRERLELFLQKIGKMSSAKISALAQRDSMTQIQKALSCSYQNAQNLFKQFSASELNPANDDAVMTAYDGGSERAGAIAKLVLDSYAGAGTITIGGGDYHNNPIMRTHAKDVEVGENIGRAILLAKEKGKDLCIHLFTDGGVAADAGGLTEAQDIPGIGTVAKVKFVGDSGTRSSAVLLFYKHNHDGSSMVREDADGPRRQVGNFKKNGGVELTTLVGNSTENLWKAVILNYLAAQGREGEFEDLFGRGSLPPNYESLIRMKKVA